ncbi:MAG: A/G-specific adenine glycosylase [Actinomycetota bacterium]
MAGTRPSHRWVARSLLRWFEPRRTRYAWRRTNDPYHVLVSEVMLQQTQASRVEPAFERFVGAYPTVEDLATASTAGALRAWAGLGYNRRAVALARTARAVVRDHAGRIPSDPSQLRTLPGIGPYTAAAVASIAFRRRVAAVDTNVRRVVARVVRGSEPDDVAPRSIQAAADLLVAAADPGRWNQAVMDLGRDVCRPVPRCDRCPLRAACRFRPGPVASVTPRRSRAEPFDGSRRQLRGQIVRELLSRGIGTIGGLCAATGQPLPRVTAAVVALADEGLVRAGAAALAGRPRGRVRLA